MRALCYWLAGVITFGLAFSLGAAEGEAEWRKVAEVMLSMRTPAEGPQSRDEALAKLKTGLEEFDAAFSAAMKAGPSNPARWDAALFQAMTGRARQVLGMAQPADRIPLSEVLKAEDATPETKSQASLIDVMASAEAAEASGGDTAAWIARAEQHLKDFPAEKANRLVEAKLHSMKATADLRTKPLDLKFTAVDGREVDLAKLRGKVVLLDFWATWCKPCTGEIPNVLAVYKEFHAKGFEIVGISLDSDKNALESFVKENGMEWPQFFDGKGWKNEVATRYSINSIPAMWLLDKKGMVASMNARGTLGEKVGELLAQ